jgi:hypothetical protein
LCNYPARPRFVLRDDITSAFSNLNLTGIRILRKTQAINDWHFIAIPRFIGVSVNRHHSL